MPAAILTERDDEPRPEREPTWTWDDVRGLDPVTRAIAAKDHLATARAARSAAA